MLFGAGNNYSTNSAQNPAESLVVSDPVYLDTATTKTTLWAKVNDNNAVDSAVWIEIRKPTQQLDNPNPAATIQGDVVLTKIPLLWNSALNRWERDPSDPQLAQDAIQFTETGKYEIFYFVRDVDTKKLAPMMHSSVYKDKSPNHAPPSPELVSPANGATDILKAVTFTWKPGEDTNGTPIPEPDGDPVTFTLEIYDVATGAIQYRKEELTTPFWSVGAEAKLIDGREYDWQVLAVDPYGGHSASGFWRFKVFDPNTTGCNLIGTVTDAGNNPLVGATVKLYNSTATAPTVKSFPSGAFNLTYNSGTYSLEVSCPGTLAGLCKNFATRTITGVVLVDNQTPTNMLVKLDDLEAPVVSSFTMPPTATTLTVTGISIAFTDNSGVIKDYCLTETNDSASCSSKWTTSNPTSYAFGSGGTKNLFAFVRDASNNVSASKMASTTITLTVTNPDLSITVDANSTGSGTIYSSPPGSQGGISCIKGSTANCSDTYTLNQIIQLSASPDWKSTFVWSGDLSGSTTPINVTMSATKNITATFNAIIRAIVGSTGYASLQDAYNVMADGATIKAQVYTFLENLTMNRPVNITLTGGLDGNYLPTGGFTVIQGGLTIERGAVVIEGISVQ
jgi:hypothetical protein